MTTHADIQKAKVLRETKEQNGIETTIKPRVFLS
jgi:hypothetical protein